VKLYETNVCDLGSKPKKVADCCREKFGGL